MKTPMFPINRERVRHHFHYCWWQYAILIVIAIFGWNLLYTMTHYRSPENKKVEWYFEGGCGMNAQSLADELLSRVAPELLPDMEEVTFAIVGQDETYGSMQLMVWMAAGQGDLYQLKRESFTRFAAEGSMVDLQPYVDSGLINVEGIDLTAGMVKNPETGEKCLYGIPADSLKGLEACELLPDGTVLSLLAAGGNTENSVKLLAWLVENMR